MKRYFLTRRGFLPLLCCVLISACLLPGCQDGKDGEPGPKGPQGSQGPQGARGPKGLDGELPMKSGFITGTVTGFLSDNTPVNEPFDCQFGFASDAVTFNSQNDRYKFFINRFDSLSNNYESNNYMYLAFDVPRDFSTANFSNGYLYVKKKLDNERSIHVNAFQNNSGNAGSVSAVPAGTLSGVAYNASTGLLTGNFTWMADNATFHNNSSNNYYSYRSSTSSGKSLTITGSFSIPVKQRIFRVAAPGQ